MRRVIWPTLCIVSSVVFAGTVILWVRSYSCTETLNKWSIDYETRQISEKNLSSSNGSLFYRQTDGKYSLSHRGFPHAIHPLEVYRRGWNYRWSSSVTKFSQGNLWDRLGFEFRFRNAVPRRPVRIPRPPDIPEGVWESRLSRPPSLTHTMTSIRLPHWLVAGLCAIAPAWWGMRQAGRVREARRLRRGLCTVCGYDLRATPAGGACPECGRKVDQATDARARDAARTA